MMRLNLEYWRELFVELYLNRPDSTVVYITLRLKMSKRKGHTGNSLGSSDASKKKRNADELPSTSGVNQTKQKPDTNDTTSTSKNADELPGTSGVNQRKREADADETPGTSKRKTHESLVHTDGHTYHKNGGYGSTEYYECSE